LTLKLEADGAERIRSALSEDELSAAAALFRLGSRPGARLRTADLQPIAALLTTDGAIGGVAAGYGGGGMKAVRAILLDKSPVTNWSLGWHQDRVIAVDKRREVPGFNGWSSKDGVLHVQAPAELIAGMLTLRIHVDPVDADNAPLIILRGSHVLGRQSESDIVHLATTLTQAQCLADPGDVWIYRTPIIHASDQQRLTAHRRVLQVDYAGFNLPGGMRWAYADLHSSQGS
jgi:hypothetical protein